MAAIAILHRLRDPSKWHPRIASYQTLKRPAYPQDGQHSVDCISHPPVPRAVPFTPYKWLPLLLRCSAASWDRLNDAR